MAHHALIRNPVTKWIPYNTAAWIKLNAYTTPQLVFPTVANGFVYECTTSGTSGSTEPVWPLTIGATVSDGGAVWTCYSTTAILAAELAALDASLQTRWDGINGSTHAPSSPIVIAGDGLAVTGLTTIARGGTLTGTVTNDIAFNDNDFPEYRSPHVGETRAFMQPTALGRGQDQFTWRCRFSDCGMQSVSAQYDLSDGQGMRPSRFWVPIRAHDKATLSQVTVNFRVGFAHTTLPSAMPTVRVIRVDAGGHAVPLTSQAAGGDVNGYVAVAKPGNASLWSPAAGAQELVVPCDQNNAIDLTQFAYYVEIVEEQWASGTGYPWQLVYKQPVMALGAPSGGLFVGGIPQGLSTTIDGYTTLSGDRICLSGMTPSTYNGIWIARAGYWARATDWQADADFSQGIVVLVDRGATNGGTAWQVSSTVASWTSGTQPPGTIPFSSITSAVAIGQAVLPSANVTGYWYQATDNAGTDLPGTEQAWPAVVGQSVTMTYTPGNSVTFTCMGLATTPVNFEPVPPTDDETLATQGTGFFAHGNIWQSVTPVFTGITDAHWQ